MNLIQVQNALKGLSDDQLSRSMQQPQGDYPPFLVLTEINRRKDMRSEYQAQIAKQTKPPLSESLPAALSSQPPGGAAGAGGGGLGSLPGAPGGPPGPDYANPPTANPRNISAPQGFAGGGVVGFQYGGNVSGPLIIKGIQYDRTTGRPLSGQSLNSGGSYTPHGYGYEAPPIDLAAAKRAQDRSYYDLYNSRSGLSPAGQGIQNRFDERYGFKYPMEPTQFTGWEHRPKRKARPGEFSLARMASPFLDKFDKTIPSPDVPGPSVVPKGSNPYGMYREDPTRRQGYRPEAAKTGNEHILGLRLNPTRSAEAIRLQTMLRNQREKGQSTNPTSGATSLQSGLSMIDAYNAQTGGLENKPVKKGGSPSSGMFGEYGKGTPLKGTSVPGPARQTPEQIRLAAMLKGRKTTVGTTGGIKSLAKKQAAPSRGVGGSRGGGNPIYERLQKRGEPDLLAPIEAKIAAMEAKVKSRRSQAGGEALMRAGLGMLASRSPFPLVGIGEGGAKGLEQYQHSMKDIRGDKLMMLKMRSALASARMAERRGDKTLAMQYHKIHMAYQAALVKAKGSNSTLGFMRKMMLQSQKSFDKDVVDPQVRQPIKGRLLEAYARAGKKPPANLEAIISFQIARDHGVYLGSQYATANKAGVLGRPKK